VDEPMSHVDLCSGIGGFALGFEWAGLSKPVLFCDIEPWSRKVLAKHWPDVPIADDVKELASDPDRFIPRTDPRNTILSSGYPCQPFSVAGKQRGTEDDRHLWPFISQIIAHKRPAFCVLENVYGHVALGLDEVLADLEAQDYAARAFIVPACAVNAPHRRDRLWIIGRNVGNSKHDGLSAATVSGKHDETSKWSKEGQNEAQQFKGTSKSRNCQFAPDFYVADTDNEGSQGRLSGRQGAEWQGEHGHARCSGAAHRQPAKDWWAVEPSMGRVAHGIPGRVDRLKGLGNAIVPQIAMQIGLTIKAVRDA
jgi:DNA (cytosine-5)-methyltransferase 1